MRWKGLTMVTCAALTIVPPGSVSSAGPVASTPDAAVLRALHEKVLVAHREGNVELILVDETQDYIVANQPRRRPFGVSPVRRGHMLRLCRVPSPAR